MERNTEWVVAWGAQEGNAFTGFTDFVATRLTGAINVSIPVWQARRLAAGKSARLELPWGIFDAKVKTVGEGTNITPTYEATDRFKTLLSDDKDREEEVQANIDSEYVKLVQDWLAYGYHDADNRPDLPAKEKGARIDTTEVEYFLHSYMKLLASIAKDHQRDGKEHTVDFVEEFDFGQFRFAYKGDEITATFTPSKAYKQMLKNDSVGVDTATEVMAMAAFTMFNQDMAKVLNGKKSKKARKAAQRDAEGFLVLCRR